jgi:hypothetical protein
MVLVTTVQAGQGTNSRSALRGLCSLSSLGIL